MRHIDQFQCVYKILTDCGKTLYYECFGWPEAMRQANQDGFVVKDVELASLDSDDFDNFIVYDNKESDKSHN